MAPMAIMGLEQGKGMVSEVGRGREEDMSGMKE